MLKNKSLYFSLVMLISCVFSSNEIRAEQALRVIPTIATADAHLSKKENIAAQKKKGKRKKSFRFFKKLKKKFAQEPGEKWLNNGALILGSAALLLLIIGSGFTLGIFSLLGLIAAILAIVFGARARKQGIRNWKNTLGLWLGIILTGLVAIAFTILLIYLLIILAAL